MNDEKNNELIMQLVSKLFFVTLTQLEYLEKRHDLVIAQRDQLDTIAAYTLDDQGLLDLRRDVSQIVGAEDYSELFDKSVVTKLAKAYANLPTPELGGSENMLQFQLGVLILRLCSDYVNASDLYERHSEGFRQQLPRIFIRNDVTGEIDWLATRDAMAAQLEKNFRERYESAEERNGGFFRKTVVANEGFVIARRIIRESAEVMHVHSGVSGIDFERHCGNQLKNQDFSVEYTKQSGDFGVDIIASKDGLRYALQCKAGQKPSGVKAVQEAAAGRQHYRADYAAVVSQSGFTRAAAELAGSMGVVLLTSSTLADIEVLVRAYEHV